MKPVKMKQNQRYLFLFRNTYILLSIFFLDKHVPRFFWARHYKNVSNAFPRKHNAPFALHPFINLTPVT